MKKAQFKKLSVGDVVYLKSIRKILNMKEWDAGYFRDADGYHWSKFIHNRDLLKGEGATVTHISNYRKDVVTVQCNSAVFEIPRKCIKNF